MKYSSTNKPMVCMMTQSTCYRGTRKMNVKGILWHSTGANNPTLKRYVQPDDNAPNRDELIRIIGKNRYNNDMNHINREMGMNAWIGKLEDGTVAAIQVMPWDYRPWGCGKGAGGKTCNDAWIQFETCEDSLNDKDYFDKVYKEGCELTAYLCKMFNIDPYGTVDYCGKKIPTILCHQDSYQYGCGNNHSDIYNWYPKFGKNMETVRNDVAKILDAETSAPEKPATDPHGFYRVRKSKNDAKSQIGAFKSENNAIEACAKAGPGYFVFDPDMNIIYPEVVETPKSTVTQMYRVRPNNNDPKKQVGAFTSLDNAKRCCDQAGVGYSVFDSDFNIVYQAHAVIPKPVPEPEKPKEEIKVYDLPYPNKIRIVDKSVSKTEVELETSCIKAIKKILSYNPKFDVNIAKTYFFEAPRFGIDPLMALAQATLETGWFRFVGSAVKPEQHNYCGLGVVSNGVTGSCFKTIREGVIAQLQHLYAYGCSDDLPPEDKVLDPRFKYVTRGIAQCWQELAGRWAVPGYNKIEFDTPEAAMKAENTYGQKIINLSKELLAMPIVPEDFKKYFPKGEDIKPTEKPVETPPETPKKSFVDVILSALKLLFQKIKNLFK